MDKFFALCIICYTARLGSAEDDALYQTVNTTDGALRGQLLPSAAGRKYWSFKGVPYARPPLGDLRFQDSEPPESWDGVRDALQEGSECIQFLPVTQNYQGSEDCLYLNVYSPTLPSDSNDSSLLPVMLFIPGGGFEFGSAAAALYSPDYIVAEDVLLVTFNYRLSVFGFLYLDKAIPGNAGLKDQVRAMQWVQRNIAYFGGDPDKVTLVGESAGAVSVHLHMMAPITEGLFQGAIAQSGAALNPWAQQHQPQEAALRLGRLLGCGQRSPSALARCLRAVDAQALIRAANTQGRTEMDQRRVLPFSWVPTPDYVTEGVESFVSEPFLDLVIQGRTKLVPYMTGFNAEEGYLALGIRNIDFSNDTVLQELDDSWEVIVPPELLFSLNRSTEEDALALIRQFYMSDTPLRQESLGNFLDLLSDVLFRYGVLFSIRHMVKFSCEPVYLYYFTADDELNFFKPTFNVSRPGAAHSDELGYLFNAFNLPNVSETSSAGQLRRRMVRMWTNFVKYGNPTPSFDPEVEVSWPPYTNENRSYLEINTTLSTGSDLYQTELDFWDTLYEQYALKSETNDF